ncbi:MAG: MBL fold metallo-hydrolase [Chloroflexi bacterium]|nr:MBL fold metallo-hydrolase [Chloroflexota bacterium]
MASTFYRVMRTQPPVAVQPPKKIIKNMRGDALEMTVFFVGSGEAILLRRHDKAILIDAGVAGSKKGKALGKKLADYIEDPNKTGVGLTLVAIVSSHPHVDHINAVPTLLAEIDTTTLSQNARYYHNGVDVADGLKPDLTAAVNAAFGRARILVVGANGGHPNSGPIVPPLAPDVTIRIAVQHGKKFESNPKYRSIFMKLRFRKAKFIFTGDANTGNAAKNDDYETRMLELLPEPSHNQDVLKITHHGSKHGTGNAFVAKTEPRISVASTSEKTDHSLKAAVRGRLRQHGVAFDTHRTGGDIIVRTDGKRRKLDGKYGILYEVEES